MSQQRQLAAIMFTDIKGYTAIMQHDENKAIAFRERHRNTFENTTEAFNGKIVQYFGDGTLSTFKSTVEAVDCAIEMQLAFLEEPMIPVRIGIHVGDIIQSEDDIIGDAVNVASRIESCAEAGSILISDKVHDQIRSHRHIQSTFLDAYEFKNVEGAMPLFAISNEGLVVPDPEDIKGKLKSSPTSKNANKFKRLSLALGALLILFIALANHFGYLNFDANINDKSIAVLPFENLSNDSDAELFRDGVTEDILTQLSKVKDLHVISRTTTRRYKDSKKGIAEIAKELNVSYILVGSVRKYGNDVRISTQLIEAKSDKNIWSDKYDITLTDIFGIQSEVSRKIVDALQLNLSFEEQQSIATVPVYNIEAYKFFLQGRQEADKRNKESLEKSIDLYKKAIAIEPEYADAYAEIANSTYLLTYYGGVDHLKAAKEVKAYLAKAEKIDDKISRIYSVKGLILNIEGKTEEAKEAFQKALKLSPNDPTARHQYATLHYYIKEYDKQLEQAEIAYKLDPLSFVTANAYFTALLTNKKYDEAERLMKKIEEEGLENNQIVIHRNYFRLYMDMRDYKNVIKHLQPIVKENYIFRRFLGYCYAKVGDTISAENMIKLIRLNSEKDFMNHELAVVYAGLKKTDSVLFHLDSIRNKRKFLVQRDYGTFFEYLLNDSRLKEKLQQHDVFY